LEALHKEHGLVFLLFCAASLKNKTDPADNKEELRFWRHGSSKLQALILKPDLKSVSDRAQGAAWSALAENEVKIDRDKFQSMAR
jgi:hypothetical protein